MGLWQKQQRSTEGTAFISKWKTNLRTMRNRIKDRVRVAAFSSYGSLRQGGHIPSLNSSTALKATATGLVVARVFKGNVVFSRLIHSKAKQECADKMAKFSSYFPDFRALVSAAPVSENGASTAAYAEPNVTSSLALTTKSNQDQEIVDAGDSSMVRMLQAVAVPLIGNVCHAFMHGLNYTEVYGAEKLQEAIKNRPKGQPLITVSNHVASVDDPLVISSVLPPRLLLDAKSIRWTLCATDRCFTNPVTSAFFHCVKVLPVARGDGIFQKGMDMALSKLNRGDWVHIFPEGSRSRDGGKTIGTAKRGIGRLVLDAERMPLVVPFVHSGMQEVMPIGSQFPHVSKKVVVLVGDPIKVDDLFMVSKEQGFSEGKLYDAISLRVGERLKELKIELDDLVYQQSLQNRNANNLHTIEMVNDSSQFVDWETNNLLSQKPLAEYGEGVSNLKEKIMSESVNQASKSDGIHQQLGGLGNDPEKGYACANDISLHHGNVSRLQGFMDPSLLMGFAARGLLMNGKRELDEPITFHNWRHRILMQAGHCIG